MLVEKKPRVLNFLGLASFNLLFSLPVEVEDLVLTLEDHPVVELFIHGMLPV